jgi:hypothetical protein
MKWKLLNQTRNMGLLSENMFYDYEIVLGPY